ncbi:MAG: transporter substrate-binding domain-containing protein [Rugosibacter sp.]|nr:MAG: transporter substrate-binding domain-containing protein [Rugosibacter sp.]
MACIHSSSLRWFATFVVAVVVLTCCAAVVPAALATTAAHDSPLRVVMDDNYPPYVIRDANGVVEGLLIDEWRLWEKKTGIKVDITATDWAKAQQIMQAGGADVIDTIFRTPARERLYDFSAAYADLPVGIYTHAGIGGIHNPASLHGFLVGVKAGDACIDRLAHFGITTLKTYPSYQAVVDAAIASQVRVFCIDEPPANYLLHRVNAAGNFRLAFTLYTGQFHRAVHQGDAATLARIEQGFAAISSTEREALRDKWMGKSLPYVMQRTVFYGLAMDIITILLLALFILLLRRPGAAAHSTTGCLPVASASHPGRLARPAFRIGWRGAFPRLPFAAHGFAGCAARALSRQNRGPGAACPSRPSCAGGHSGSRYSRLFDRQGVRPEPVAGRGLVWAFDG